MKRRFVLATLILTSGLFADSAPPLGSSTIMATVGFNGHVIPSLGYGHTMPSPIRGFTALAMTDVQVTGVRNTPFALQTVVTESLCEVRPLGEYITYGGCGGMGVSEAPQVMQTRRTTTLATKLGMAGGGDFIAMYGFGKSQHWKATARVGILGTSAGGEIMPDARLGVSFWFGQGKTIALLKKAGKKK